jgi:hypothetical protein
MPLTVVLIAFAIVFALIVRSVRWPNRNGIFAKRNGTFEIETFGPDQYRPPDGF